MQEWRAPLPAATAFVLRAIELPKTQGAPADRAAICAVSRNAGKRSDHCGAPVRKQGASLFLSATTACPPAPFGPAS